MSRAIICDKCDLILPTEGNYKTVFMGYTHVEWVEKYHLCEKCLAMLDEWVNTRDEELQPTAHG